MVVVAATHNIALGVAGHILDLDLAQGLRHLHTPRVHDYCLGLLQDNRAHQVQHCSL